MIRDGKRRGGNIAVEGTISSQGQARPGHAVSPCQLTVGTDQSYTSPRIKGLSAYSK